MDELFKAIFKLEGDSSHLIKELEAVNSKFVDQNAELKKQQIHLKTLQDNEAALMRGRAAAQNPTAIVKYNKALEENKKKIDEVKKATEDLTVTEQKNAKVTEDLGKKLNTAFETTSIRGQLRLLKEQLTKTTDDAEFLKLSIQAGKLEDKINSASAAAQIFATDSPFKAVGNGIRAVAGDLLSMDFASAAQKAKLLSQATKQITFSSAVQGMKDLGTTLLNVGKSLLLNPIFLIGTAITLIISNFEKLKNSGGIIGKMFTTIGDTIDLVIDAFVRLSDWIGLTAIQTSKAIENTLNELARMQSTAIYFINYRYDYEIAKARAAGKEIIGLEIEKRKEILKTYEDAIKAQFDMVNGSEASIQRALKFERSARKEMEALKREIEIIEIEQAKKNQDEINAIKERSIKRNMEAQKKGADEIEKHNKEVDDRIKAEEKEKNDALIKDAQDFKKKNEEFDKDEEKTRREENEKLKQSFKERKQMEEDAAAHRTALMIQQIDQIATISNAVFNAASQVLNAEGRKYDKLTSLQEKRVEDSKRLAEKGNAELLELEQQRLDQVNQQREQFVRRQQALATLELIANTAIAVSKAAAQGGVAAGITIAAALIALVGGLASARSISSQAAFYEGGYTGDGDPKQTSTAVGRKAYTYHKGEFVMDHNKTAQYRDIFEGIHSGHINLHDWKNKVQMFEAMKLMPIGGKDIDFTELKREMAMIRMAVEGQSTSVSLNEHGLSMRFRNIKTRDDLIRNHLARA